MAQIEYQSMFIPTNMNLMQQNIGKRDAQYDQNESAIAAAEDQYAGIVSDPTAVQYKNNLLNSFKEKTNKLIDTYGGDLGAIDKRTLINHMNSIRPDIQAIQRHAALKEEERQAANKLGHWAIPLGGSVIKDSRGNQIGDPIHAIKDKRAYIEDLQLMYGDLAKKAREENLKTVEGIEGLLQAATTRGLTEDEMKKLIPVGADYLTKTDPDLANNPNLAMQLASEFMPQLVQGITRQYIQDPLAIYRGKKTSDSTSPMVDYMQTGFDVSKDNSLSKLLNKTFNSRKLDIWADFDRPDNSFVSKSRQAIIDKDPIAKMFEKSIIKGNENLSQIKSNPFSIADINYGNEFASKYIDKKILPVQKMKEKYNIDLNKEWRGIIDVAERDYGQDGPGFENLIMENIASMIEIKNPNVGRRESMKMASDLMNVYANNNQYYKKTMNDAVSNIEKTGVLPSNTFDFKTFDLTTDAGINLSENINKFVKNDIISANNLEFISPEFSDEKTSKILDKYNSNKTKPYIKGISQDDQNGTIFIVNGPEGEDVIVRPRFDKNLEYKIAFAMGNLNVIPNDKIMNAFKNIKTGDPILGYKAKSYTSNGSKTVSLEDNEGNPFTVGEMREFLMEAGPEYINNANLAMTGAKDTDPYQFKSPELMMKIIKYKHGE